MGLTVIHHNFIDDSCAILFLRDFRARQWTFAAVSDVPIWWIEIYNYTKAWSKEHQMIKSTIRHFNKWIVDQSRNSAAIFINTLLAMYSPICIIFFCIWSLYVEIWETEALPWSPSRDNQAIGLNLDHKLQVQIHTTSEHWSDQSYHQ